VLICIRIWIFILENLFQQLIRTIDFNTPLLAQEHVNLLSESLVASFRMFGGSFTPTVFGKYLITPTKATLDLARMRIFRLVNHLMFMPDFLRIKKPFNAWEERFVRRVLTLDTQNKSSLEFFII